LKLSLALLLFASSLLLLTINSILDSELQPPPNIGPDRLLYLPGGLLDRSEIPSYLNGTLAGE
jgi:hypothetical protein